MFYGCSVFEVGRKLWTDATEGSAKGHGVGIGLELWVR